MTSLQSLIKIIKLKQLSKKLSHVEFGQFMTSASQRVKNREIIFNVLSGHATKCDDPQLINNLIKIISEIIQTRKNHKQSTTSKVDNLPHFFLFIH